MKVLCVISTAMIVAPILAVAQEAARDITREMGADTTTSVSQGLDRTGLHRDTEMIKRGQQHAPSLLETPRRETSNVKKLSKSVRKQLLRQRELLVKRRTAAIEAAGAPAGATKKSGGVYAMSEQTTEDVGEARKKAERDWDAKWGHQVQSIDRVLKEGTKRSTDARFHAPSLINPK
jgi:hypothetical protein